MPNRLFPNFKFYVFSPLPLLYRNYKGGYLLGSALMMISIPSRSFLLVVGQLQNFADGLNNPRRGQLAHLNFVQIRTVEISSVCFPTCSMSHSLGLVKFNKLHG